MFTDEYRLRRIKIHQYFYHITEQKWGKSITLYPRNHGIKRCPNEPMIERICVGPSVVHCLSATVLDSIGFRVYKTKCKVISYYPIGVIDSRYTWEKWLIGLTEFTYICKIPDDLVIEIWENSLDGTNGVDLFGKIPEIRKIVKRYNFPEYP